MTNNIEKLKLNITKAEAFLSKYGDQLSRTTGHLSVSSYGVDAQMNKEDAPIMGEVFGKAGWTRKIDTYSSEPCFNWKKTVDGVGLTISRAEDCDLNDSPVPEKAFPILLN